jgi:oxygen-dependent protoporphyrinogen oxidase
LLDDAQNMALEIIIHEADSSPGGHLRTISDNGWQLEVGPNGFLDNEPATLKLIDRVGLSGSLVRSTDAARRRFLMKNGRLHELPASPGAFLKTGLLGWRDKMRVAGEIFVPTRKFSETDHDETIYEFGVRRLGREFAEIFLDPMVKGIFGGDARQLSLAAAFPRMVELERDHGGLFKAMAALSRQRKKAAEAGPGGVLHSFTGGMADLITGLTTTLQNDDRVTFKTNDPVRSLKWSDSGWSVNDSSETYDAVIGAAPAHATAEVIPDPKLAAEINSIGYEPMAVITLGFRREQVRHDLDGFGHLIPTRENRRLLGALWTSSIFPGRAPDGSILLRCMAGGPGDPDILSLSDDELTATALSDLRSLLGLEGDPDCRWVIRHPAAIAQYRPGHLARLERIETHLKALPGLFLTGSSYHGISVNHCIKEAGNTAAQVVSMLNNSSTLALGEQV